MITLAALAYSTIQAGAADPCPNNDCIVYSRSYQGTNGMNYSLVDSTSGLVWINDANGEELTSESAAELGLQAPVIPQLNNALVPGFNYNINAWTKIAKELLKKPKCAEFFGGRGLRTLAATHFQAYADNPSVFAETYAGSTVVWINIQSPLFQALPGDTFYGGLRPGGLSADNAGAVGILHELNHQLTSITGAGFDAGDANIGVNYWNTLRVLNNCFGD
jgi:hypothetical protein